MLTLIEGGFSSGLFDEMKKRIARSCEQGRRVYLIVPEQQTVISEAQMTDCMPNDAPLYFEVTNFTRLANTAFRALGGIANEYCDNTKKKLLMWKALGEIAPLTSGAKGIGEIPAALAEKYLSATAEMQSMCIGAEELSELAKSEEICKDARLKSKLEDLSMAMAVYKRLLSEKYSDTADDIGAMIKKLDAHPEFLTDADIYVDGFTSFTAEQYRLIGKLAQRTAVTVSLTIPKTARDSFEYSEVAHAHERITSAASRCGSDVRLVRIDGKFGRSNDILYELTDKLWHFNASFDNDCLQNPDVIRLFTARTPFDMCDFVSADIRKKVRLGASYCDFAIVTGSKDAYAGILDASLKKYGIPSFVSYKREADELSAIKLIYAAYSVIRSGFAREDVIAYAKCGFTGLDAEDIDIFEMYVNRWRIDRARFTDGLIWRMNPHGYEAARGDDDEALLQRIDAVKKAIIEPLSDFADEARECTTVREHATALVKFLVKIDLEGRLMHKARTLLIDKEAAEAEEYSRIWSTVCHSLDSLVEVMDDTAASCESFLIQLKIVFSSVEIGRIPAYTDEVTVGSADMLRLYEKKHVYLVGVNEGEFPRSASDGSYFGEKDRQLMAIAGVDFSASAEIRNARELFCFSRATSYASDSITLIYSESTSSLKAIKRSDAIDRIVAMSGGRLNPKKIYELPAADRIWTPKSAVDTLGELGDGDYEELKAALREVGEGAITDIAEASVTNDGISLSREIAETMYKDRLTLSQSKIDSYVDCPLKYFCRYNLALSEEEIYEFGAANIGTFIHAILENFFKTLRERGKTVRDLDEKERDAMTAAAAKSYLLTLGDGLREGGERMKIRIARLVRAARPVIEGLCDEFADCGYIPTFFELRISDRDKELPSTPTFTTNDGKPVKVYGVVDRVDTYNHGGNVYVRVVDYKTGSKTFSTDDVEKKRNLQMFLYLKAISESNSETFRSKLGVEDDGEILPAGVIYVNTAISDVKVSDYNEQTAVDAVKKLQKRQGMLLDDSVSINAMNGEFIPIKFSKGEVSESSKALLYSREGWVELMKKVQSAVVEVSDKICSGVIAPVKEKDDKNNPCEYCNYKPICRRVNYN